MAANPARISISNDGVAQLKLNPAMSTVSLRIDLQPGFTLFEGFYSFGNLTKQVNISDEVALSFDIRFGIPLDMHLQTEVAIFAGFTLSDF